MVNSVASKLHLEASLLFSTLFYFSTLLDLALESSTAVCDWLTGYQTKDSLHDCLTISYSILIYSTHMAIKFFYT